MPFSHWRVPLISVVGLVAITAGSLTAATVGNLAPHSPQSTSGTECSADWRPDTVTFPHPTIHSLAPSPEEVFVVMKAFGAATPTAVRAVLSDAEIWQAYDYDACIRSVGVTVWNPSMDPVGYLQYVSSMIKVREGSALITERLLSNIRTDVAMSFATPISADEARTIAQGDRVVIENWVRQRQVDLFAGSTLIPARRQSEPGNVK